MGIYGSTQRYLVENCNWMSPEKNKLASSLVLSVSSAPAKILKTQQQLSQEKQSFLSMIQTRQVSINSFYNTFLPLSMHATSSAVFLLVGTKQIQKIYLYTH